MLYLVTCRKSTPVLTTPTHSTHVHNKTLYLVGRVLLYCKVTSGAQLSPYAVFISCLAVTEWGKIGQPAFNYKLTVSIQRFIAYEALQDMGTT